jgi:hypothetical protein
MMDCQQVATKIYGVLTNMSDTWNFAQTHLHYNELSTIHKAT